MASSQNQPLVVRSPRAQLQQQLLPQSRPHQLQPRFPQQLQQPQLQQPHQLPRLPQQPAGYGASDVPRRDRFTDKELDPERIWIGEDLFRDSKRYLGRFRSRSTTTVPHSRRKIQRY